MINQINKFCLPRFKIAEWAKYWAADKEAVAII
jgi:hypothetical protein